jgi:hypothetical protein
MGCPMARRLKTLDQLKDEQLKASSPRELVWLSASAGKIGRAHV